MNIYIDIHLFEFTDLYKSENKNNAVIAKIGSTFQ